MNKTLAEFLLIVKDHLQKILYLKINPKEMHQKDIKLQYEQYKNYPVRDFYFDNGKLCIVIKQQAPRKIKVVEEIKHGRSKK